MRLQATCLLALAVLAAANNYPRQDPPDSSSPAPSAPPPSSSSSAPPSSSSTPPPPSSPPPSSSSTPPPSSSSTPPPTETTPPPTTPPPTQTTPPPNAPSLSVSEIDGVDVTVTVTNTSSASSSSASASETGKPAPKDSEGLSTGSIVGMSVAGGLALIGIIAFFVWKFTRKRFSGFDDNEAIKWPDLNSHSGTAGLDAHPLPARDTGRSGFDTASDGSLTRMNTENYSTPDFASGTHDPYAVPPLPHLNPNQPYRDDPTAASGYYDPYRGPVPGTLEHGSSDWHGEAIPMNQINAGGGAPPYDQVGFEQPVYANNAGRVSPGPNVAYGGGEQPVYNAGRASPGPHMAYQPYSEAPAAGRTSPGPQAAYGGRTSPGPNVAYGGRMSPGPGVAYNNTGGYGQPAPGYDGGYGR